MAWWKTSAWGRGAGHRQAEQVKKEGEKSAYICGIKGTTEQFLQVIKGEGLVKQTGIKSYTCIVRRNNSQTKNAGYGEIWFLWHSIGCLGRGVRPELENINLSKDGSHDMILSCRSDEGKGLHNRLSVWEEYESWSRIGGSEWLEVERCNRGIIYIRAELSSVGVDGRPRIKSLNVRFIQVTAQNWSTTADIWRSVFRHNI